MVGALNLDGLDVLVIGGGGREHALALALRQDPQLGSLHCAPGNPGTQALGTNHPVQITDPDDVVTLARRLGVGLVVVGPEAPLVAGVADAVREAGIACFGPSAAAARIEGSKAFAKEIMQAAGVPTAAARVCRTRAEVAAALTEFGAPYVVKDDGLASGKGVLVSSDAELALAHAATCERVLVEEFLDGPEISLFALTDGSTVLPLQPAQDFKRAYDDDEGPNTGGMGAYTPVPWVSADLVAEVLATVLQPTVDELAARGTPFAGLLYAGLALTSAGVRVVEFNARFGDPETQALLSRLRTPLAGLLYRAATGGLAGQEPLDWSGDAAVAVVLGAEGYPAAPITGGLITGPTITAAERPGDGGYVVHAGTGRDEQGRLVSSGGRVLAVVGTGPDLRVAREQAYAGIAGIELPGSFYRRDIALRAAATSSAPGSATGSGRS